MRAPLQRWAAAALACFFLCALLLPNIALAAGNVLNRYEVDVALDAQGNGTITETRTMDLREGTENYIVISNLKGADIRGFTVSENGQPFTDVGNWNTKASRAEKAGKSGIIRKEDGYELCWGIGEYGPHTYRVTYQITGLVRQLKDGQSLYWRFWNPGTNTPPKEAHLRIHGPQPFSPEQTKIWGFGFPGKLGFSEGHIVARTSEPLSADHHITILAQFVNSPFQPVLSQDSTLADQEALAKTGSSYGDGKSGGKKSPFDAFNNFMAKILGVVAAVFFLVSSFFMRFVLRKQPGRFDVPKKIILSRNKDRYYRDVPYAGDITDVHSFLTYFGYGSLEHYFNAFLLKWLQEGRVRQAEITSGRFFKKEAKVIEILPGADRPIEDDLEKRFFDMLEEAAGDHILEANEFSAWAKEHNTTIESWEDALENRSSSRLLKSGHFQIVDQGNFFLSLFISKANVLTDEGNALMDRIVGYRNYLKDFSLLSEREAPEVGIWKQLFIWAALYGMADEVAKAFRDLYPNYTPESVDGGLDLSDVLLMSAFSHSFTSSYHSAQITSSDSGGGGFTSIGGGGGSFGGGFGGGTR